MIYFVEDDSAIRELVVYTLNNTGFQAKGFENAESFWQAMAKEIPQLVLLDVMLPREDGIAVLKKLRAGADTKWLPVMMITAKGSEYDKVFGFETGADDYLPKPFGMMEMVARVKSLLRRAERVGREEIYTLGGLRVDVRRHEVQAAGETVKLTLKEFELLCFMLKNKGIALTRDQLLTAVWGYAFEGESRTLDVHIRTLRGKLGESGSCIETVRGLGYKIAEGGGKT